MGKKRHSAEEIVFQAAAGGRADGAGPNSKGARLPNLSDVLKRTSTRW
jgi:hypothetical protein